LEINRIVS